MSILRLLRHRSFQVILLLALFILTARQLPLAVHQALYTLSLFIKDLLIWIMPLTVGCFIAKTVASFKRRAPALVLTLLIFEACSNLTSVWYAYFSGSFASGFLPSLNTATFNNDFHALWRLPLKKPDWWSPEKGSLFGIGAGCLTAFYGEKFKYLTSALDSGKRISEWLLTRVFSRLIPVFILGFAAQIYQTGLLSHLIAHYSLVVLWLLGVLVFYLIFLFAIGASGKIQTMKENIKNLLPAGGLALTSGCSLSTMPWTIQGTEKNLNNPALAKAIIPATTNIQQIGDCIANAFLCCLIYKNFNGHLPSFTTWLTFSFVFTIARFATAAVLGGAIFIMLPIYETYLHFTPEMISIILAFNVILDSLVTSSNVVANGALCRIFERVWEWQGRHSLKTQTISSPN